MAKKTAAKAKVVKAVVHGKTGQPDADELLQNEKMEK